jgi:tripartite-type tricarboxylate transporter receptor subunit TctC
MMPGGHVRKTTLRGDVLLFCSIFLTMPSALAQSYPDKPLRFIVPFPPGGGSDLVGRILARELAPALGQPVIVDNRGGLAGSIGTAAAAKATPDGYTFVATYVGTMAINPWVYKNPGYDPLKDFTQVSLTTTQPNVLVVNPHVYVTKLKDFAALPPGRTQPLTFGYSGAANQLGGKLLEMLTGTKMLFVPFKGGGPVATAVVGGHVDVMLTGPATTLAFVKNEKLRAIAITGPRRIAALPDVPTSREAGLPDFEVIGWYGVAAPAGTPSAIVARMNKELASVLAKPDIREKFLAQGLQAESTTPEATSAYVRTEYRRWEKIVKASGITPE